MGRVLCAIAVVLCLLAWAPSAAAAGEWCEFDPVVLVITPGGAIVPVFVTNGAQGVEHLAGAQLAEMRYSAQPAKSGAATQVQLRVLIRGDLFDKRFPTRSTVSSGPLATGHIFARADGVSGDTMQLAFVLDVP